jgi:hypothetical protein
MSKTHKSIKEINEYLLMTVMRPRKLKEDRAKNLTVRDLEQLQKTSVYIRKLLEEKTKLFYGKLMN